MVLMKYEIKWKSGRIITDAETVEDAIKKFKELGIEVEDKEISIASFGWILSRISLVRDFFYK